MIEPQRDLSKYSDVASLLASSLRLHSEIEQADLVTPVASDISPDLQERYRRACEELYEFGKDLAQSHGVKGTPNHAGRADFTFSRNLPKGDQVFELQVNYSEDLDVVKFTLNRISDQSVSSKEEISALAITGFESHKFRSDQTTRHELVALALAELDPTPDAAGHLEKLRGRTEMLIDRVDELALEIERRANDLKDQASSLRAYLTGPKPTDSGALDQSF